MFTRDELIRKLNEFLKEKNTTVKSTLKDYKVDIKIIKLILCILLIGI